MGNLERVVGDYGIEQGFPLSKTESGTQPDRIAVIGAGPAGLTCAYQLARLGYTVRVFEASPKPGGLLRYGIPRFRLPEHVLDAEIARIEALGVSIECNTTVEAGIAWDEWTRDYDAVFVAIGAGKSKLLGIPGEEYENVWAATEFLHAMTDRSRVDIGQNAVVIGGGNAAMDAARVCRRAGAEATLVYHRTAREMPAMEAEVQRAREEGVQFQYLMKPVGIAREEGQTVVKCQQTRVGELDASGRGSPVPVDGEVLLLDASIVVLAVGQKPDTAGLCRCLWTDERSANDAQGRTSVAGVYAGGDVLGAASVANAIAQGNRGARAIHRDLRGISEPVGETGSRGAQRVSKERMNRGWFPWKSRKADALLMDVGGSGWDGVQGEAQRCMSCGVCFDCGHCWSLCGEGAIVRSLIQGQPCTFKAAVCQGCGKCSEQCPCGGIEME